MSQPYEQGPMAREWARPIPVDQDSLRRNVASLRAASGPVALDNGVQAFAIHNGTLGFSQAFLALCGEDAGLTDSARQPIQRDSFSISASQGGLFE